MPWGYLLFCVVTLGLYLGFAYMVHRIQNWYGTSIIITSILCKALGLMVQTTVYGFLDPAKGSGHLAAYIVGIAVGGIVAFVIMWAVSKLRDWIFRQGRGVKVVDLSEHQSEKMRTVHV